ncbi:hypothetical protein AK830_g10764 [Neonectria ditissima]|uniref:Uncharacterized protein n=1 Tax=Neonectria ditissima TaxID=78410 RepID=A0A0N8H5C5_9HYPO|nr:hypothetical protein AK830_g10764 [Neonectria ditissima]
MSGLPSPPLTPRRVPSSQVPTLNSITDDGATVCEYIIDIQKHLRTLEQSNEVALLVEPDLGPAWDNMERQVETIASWHANIAHPLTRHLAESHVEMKALLERLDDHTQMLEQKLLDNERNEVAQGDDNLDAVQPSVAIHDLISDWNTFSHLLRITRKGFHRSLTQHTCPWAVDTTKKLLCKARQINEATNRLTRATLRFNWEPIQLGFRTDAERVCISSQGLQAKAESIVANVNHLVNQTLPRNLSWIKMASDTATRECFAIEEQEHSISKDAIRASRALLLTLLTEWEVRRRLFL